MRIESHPRLDVLAREDGCVFLPQSGNHKPGWTYGAKSKGYRYVSIARKRYFVHRLVAETYIGEIPDGYEIDHIDRNRSNNSKGNIRIVTHSLNMRNTRAHDNVTAQGGTHSYQDWKQYKRERGSRYYAENKDKILERHAHYYAENKDKILDSRTQYYAKNNEKVRLRASNYNQDKRRTHRVVHFSDGSKHWIPNEEAKNLLAIPLKERHYG